MSSLHFKIMIFWVLIFSFTNSNSQINESSNPKINAENYYDYYQSVGTEITTTSWLKRNEAVPVIIDELEKLGFETKQYILFELENEDEIILDVYNRKYDIGIVFNTGHLAFPNKAQRNTRVFNQKKFKITGRLGRRKVYKDLPKNIIVIQETWYWYQTQSKLNQKLVSKTTAKLILREDVRNRIAELLRK